LTKAISSDIFETFHSYSFSCEPATALELIYICKTKFAKIKFESGPASFRNTPYKNRPDFVSQ